VKPPPLGLYVHVPWCVRKCPYCDFNSHRANGVVPERDYIAALLRDLDQEIPRIADRPIASVFLGGGTPSLLSADAIRTLLDGIRARVRLTPDAEITLEANPGTAESAKFEGFRRAGVNRLSLGVQSFDDAKLRALGRIHDRRAAVEAVRVARAAGFDNCNLDLMFGLPGQTVADVLHDLQTAIGLRPSHISFYQLTLEPNTWFHRFPPALPTEDEVWEMQLAGQSLLREGGFQQYEVSAYARPDHRCRHNLNYWRFGDYLGIGAGAHGKLTDPDSGVVTRTWKVKHPARYLEAAGQPKALGDVCRVETGQLPFEFLMNQLRLRDGFTFRDFTDRTGLPRSALEPTLSECLAEGLLEMSGDRIRCSDTGWNFLDDVLQRFLPPS
jgi:oxygen-independent coproporphyrinogen-3 oxidase